MNEPHTGFNLTLFLHAGYVAFVFAVLFFGALAFRQVIDNMEVRRLHMGEDRDAYLDAAGSIAMMVGWALVFLMAIVFYGILPASVYIYAVPLVFSVQLLQISLRLLYQRTQVKTKGLVVRSVLFDRVRAIPFAEIVVVRFVKGRLWTEVRVGLQQEEVGFRIFSFSAESLERIMQASTPAPVLWSSTRAENHR